MNLFAQLRDYFASSRRELEAVRWPTRQETIRYSTLVIAISIIFAMFFGALDFGLNRLVQLFVASQPAPIEQGVPGDITPTTSPVQVEATTDSGAPAEIKVVPTPIAPQN
jgi:preprotein translocase subunit SecE